MNPMICLFLTLLLASCESEDPKTELEKLPPETQEGKNTFGCLVDGKAWVTKTSVDAEAYYQAGVLSISAGLINNSFYQGISISLFDPSLTAKHYILIEYPQGEGLLDDLRTNCRYLTSATNSGKLIITHLDQTKFIISGTFEFEAYSSDCSNIIKITQGRFDLTYAP